MGLYNLTHDQFGKIPQSPEIQLQVFESELRNVELDLQAATKDSETISKALLKDWKKGNKILSLI